MKNHDALHLLERELKQLSSSTLGRRAFLQAMPLLLAACSSAPQHRTREGDNKGQETEMTVEDEKKMTAEYLPEMKKEYPAHKDKELQVYINNLGQKVVTANNLNRKPYTYSFTVVDVNYVNAFALPAGTVMVTKPLLAMAETEAELAGVVGHEVGHIMARHTAERIDAAKKAQNKSILYGALGGIAGAGLGFGLGKLLCRREDKACLQRAALYGAAAGVGGGLLIQKFAFMANSREDEMEADRIGFRTSVAAGFHKDHVGKFYEKLLTMEKKAKGGGNALTASIADAMSTHPPSDERVAQMKQMASVEKRANGEISSKEFDQIKKRIS